jgi:hypothetical protein
VFEGVLVVKRRLNANGRYIHNRPNMFLVLFESLSDHAIEDCYRVKLKLLSCCFSMLGRHR